MADSQEIPSAESIPSGEVGSGGDISIGDLLEEELPDEIAPLTPPGEEEVVVSLPSLLGNVISQLVLQQSARESESQF